MTSLLSPGYSLTLGSQQWSKQLVRLEVSLAPAPEVDALVARFPAAVAMTADLGDSVALTLNSGEKEKAVFSGAIAAIERNLQEIRVTALDGGGALAQFRPATTYEQVTAGSVVRYLCDDSGVDVGDVADGVSLAYYAADPSRSALDHIARVCGWSGAMARVTADNRLESVVVNATQPELALLFGREIHSIENRRMPEAVTSFTVAGESGADETSAPEALRPSTDFFAGSRPDGPALKARWRSEPALRTAAAAGTASAALQRSYKSSRERGELCAFLQPELRPGTILEVQSLPEGWPSAPLWVHRVRHELDGTAARTRVEFYKGGDSFDPGSLLSSLIGAIGGLL